MKDRDRLFRDFHKRVGLPKFGPEFIDSLIHVMRSSKCLSEQIWAWTRWRSWCNSSEYAVSDWDPDLAYPLDQIDCALDLTWLREGKPVEWVEGAPRDFREQERQRLKEAIEKRKSTISRGFAKVEARGSLQFDRRRVYAVVSPQVIDSPSKVACNSNFRVTDEAFMAWWKVADNSNFQAFQIAYNSYTKELKVARKAYRRYRESATFAPDILIEVKDLPNSSNGKQASTPEPLPVSEPPDACLPAIEIPLTDLRTVFTGEIISDRTLLQLDEDLARRYHGRGRMSSTLRTTNTKRIPRTCAK